MAIDSQRALRAQRAPSRDGLGVLGVIVLTAQHGETEEKALDLGAHDYLSMPVQTRSLVARVRAVLNA